MMPVVRISDATLADLRSISAWYGVDTPPQTIELLVEEAMKKLGLERDIEPVEAEEPEEGDRLEFTRTPGLAFSKLETATVAGNALTSPNWAALLIETIRAVKAKGVQGERLVEELGVPTRIGAFEEQGYTHYPDLGISVQGQSAPDAWREVSRLGEKWGIPVVVQFHWRQNPKAQHPGRRGTLRTRAA